MEGFITFLFFFVLFAWVMKKIFPLLLAWLIKRQVKKGGPAGFGFWSNGFGGPQNGGQYNGQYSEQKKEEGKVVITDIPKQEKVIDKEIGEYVDFEE